MVLFYFLGLAGGIAFGWLQCRFLYWVIGHQGKARPLLLLVKLLVWGGSMALLAVWSVPVLICFVLGASAAMLATAFRANKRGRKEE